MPTIFELTAYHEDFTPILHKETRSSISILDEAAKWVEYPGVAFIILRDSGLDREVVLFDQADDSIITRKG